MSLSDLMILLFIFFVVLFAFTRSKLNDSDLLRIVATLRNDKTIDPIEKVKTDLQKWVKDEKLDEEIAVKQTPDGIEIQIKDKLLFGSGEFIPFDSANDVMRRLAMTLEKIPKTYNVGIEGHTDDVPIHTKSIQDNWDLSAKRAWAVMNSLSLSEAIQKRTVIMAFGDSKPIVPNRDPAGKMIPENQIKNRRVTIRIF